MAHGVPARVQHKSLAGQENLAHPNLIVAKAATTPHKNMPDFQRMHEDWEAKQREHREAARKPATKPVAFSLSASNKRTKKRLSGEERAAKAQAKASSTTPAAKPLPSVAEPKTPSPLREQVMNTAAAALDKHRAVFEAATPVSLPSSIAVPLPPVPEPLPAPSGISTSTVHHVRFAGITSEEDDCEREPRTPAPPKKSVVSTPFHKRMISQLPPIVATQRPAMVRDQEGKVDIADEVDVEAQLPAGAAFYSSPCVPSRPAVSDHWPELRAFATEPDSLHQILNYRADDDVTMLRRASALAQSVAPARASFASEAAEKEARRASIYFGPLRVPVAGTCMGSQTPGRRLGPPALAPAAAVSHIATPHRDSKTKRPATALAEELTKLVNTPSRKYQLSEASQGLLNRLGTPGKRVKAMPLTLPPAPSSATAQPELGWQTLDF